MAMIGELKHVLENVFNSQKEIVLNSPIEFDIIGDNVKHYIIKVYLKGRSWKMVDDFNNEWTISTLPVLWQPALARTILSMKDNRVTPPNWNLSL